VFYEAYSLGSPESELTFPLSPRCVLHGSYEAGPTRLAVQPVRSRAVEIINRRIASGATRSAFCHERADWVLRLIRKGSKVYHPIQFVGKIAGT